MRPIASNINPPTQKIAKWLIEQFILFLFIYLMSTDLSAYWHSMQNIFIQCLNFKNRIKNRYISKKNNNEFIKNEVTSKKMIK